jgi:hypothetical protein
MNAPLRAFHGDPAIKRKYVARVIAHRKADNLVRGVSWDGHRGCAVGCTLEAYDHSLYPVEIGVPEWLARVEDRLFENMGLERSMEWPHQFLEAIPVGADLDSLKPAFLIAVLRDARESVDPKFTAVLAAIDRVIELWQRTDLYSPAWAAAGAATGTVWAAGAAEAAWAAEAAAGAAWAAAGPAWVAEAATGAAEAAGAAAGVAKYESFADTLLDLMRKAPVLA